MSENWLHDAGWHFVKLDCIVRFMQRNNMTREPIQSPWFRQVRDEDNTGCSTWTVHEYREGAVHQIPNLSGLEICRTWRHQMPLYRGTSGASWMRVRHWKRAREGWLNRLESEPLRPRRSSVVWRISEQFRPPQNSWHSSKTPFFEKSSCIIGDGFKRRTPSRVGRLV